MSTFNFVIEYRKGKLNPADGLSRRPDYMKNLELPGNELAPLLASRLLGAGNEHADRMLGVESVAIRVLTRGRAKRP